MLESKSETSRRDHFATLARWLLLVVALQTATDAARAGTSLHGVGISCASGAIWGLAAGLLNLMLQRTLNRRRRPLGQAVIAVAALLLVGLASLGITALIGSKI